MQSACMICKYQTVLNFILKYNLVNKKTAQMSHIERFKMIKTRVELELSSQAERESVTLILATWQI